MVSHAHPLVRLDELAPEELTQERVGEPALELRRAASRGLPVAESWVIPAPCLAAALSGLAPDGVDVGALARAVHRPRGIERLAAAREALLTAPLPADLLAAVGRLHAAGRSAMFQVRPSPSGRARFDRCHAALDEAGTRTNSFPELAEAIRRTWALVLDLDLHAAARSERRRVPSLAVLLQRIPHVVTEVWIAAGPGVDPWGARAVVTARDPRDGRDAAGEAPCDVFRLDERGEVLERRIAWKWTRDDPGARGGRASRAQALGKRALRELARWSRTLGRQGFAEEAELVVCKELGPLLLDLRPLPRFSQRRVLSRATFADSLPGVPTAITWSLGRGFSEAGVREAVTAMGCRWPRGAQPLQEVLGRPYLDLGAVVPVLAELPGVAPALLLELADPLRAEELARALGVTPRRGRLLGLALSARKLLPVLRTVEAEVAALGPELEEQRRWLAELDLGLLPDDGLVTTLRETRALYERSGRLLAVTALGTIACHVGLESILARTFPGTAQGRVHALSAGVGGLESLALAADAAPVLRALGATPTELGAPGWRELAPRVGAAVDAFLREHGDRALAEAELATPRFREAPEPLFRMFQAARPGGALDVSRRVAAARAEADRALEALGAAIGFAELSLVRAVLKRYRAVLRLRERVRVWMARAMTLVRGVVLDVDRRLRRLDPTLPDGVAFHLEVEELIAAMRTERRDRGPLSALRRARHERLRSYPEPPESLFEGLPRFPLPPRGLSVLRGGAASAGTVTARVAVVGPSLVGLERFRPGDVLAVRAPDPCLAVLLPQASALVAEHGAPLAHAAVVARELGIPAVLGVAGLLGTLRPGERVHVDGTQGTVERLDG